MKYFIEHNQYTNEKGNPSAPYFKVYNIRKVLGLIPYKKYSTRTVSGMGHTIKKAITFKSEELAETFIRNVLCEGIKTEHIHTSTIKEIKCVVPH